MNKKYLLALVFILTLKTSLGSIPTTEELFRNGNNAEVSANLIMIKFNLTEKSSEYLLEKQISELPEEEISKVSNDEKNYYVKLLFSEDEDKRVHLIQAIYLNSTMSEDSLVSVRYYSNLKDIVKRSKKVLGLFYATLSSLVLNRSDEINDFLKFNSKKYKSNTELLDRERLDLYKRYKRYLSIIKEDSSLGETLNNPMKPTDDTKREYIKNLNKKPLVKRDPFVFLVKNQKQFFWKVENDVLSAVFELKTRRLESLGYGLIDKNIKLSFDQYMLFDGTHELPKAIKINIPSTFYEIRVTSLSHLLLRNKKMPKRYLEYKKILENNKKEEISLFLVN